MLVTWKERMCSSESDVALRICPKIVSKTLNWQIWAGWENLTVALWHFVDHCWNLDNSVLWRLMYRQTILMDLMSWGLRLSHGVGLSPSISRGWLPLKLDLPPRLGGDAGLKLSSATVAKPRAHPEEVLFDSRLSARSPESIEGVILHGTFPQVFTALFTRQTEGKRSLYSWQEYIYTSFHLIYRKIKMCSCSLVSSSSSTTIKVSFFFWKSSFIILGQKKRPIFWFPS